MGQFLGEDLEALREPLATSLSRTSPFPIPQFDQSKRNCLAWREKICEGSEVEPLVHGESFPHSVELIA